MRLIDKNNSIQNPRSKIRNRKALASRLIDTARDPERKKLLTANRGIADAALARELKEYCYHAWTSEPVGAQRAAAALKSLVEFAPDKESDAMRHWVEGIASITKGNLEASVESLKNASTLLKRLDREHESAQPLVAMLIALAMLGRYDDARRTGEKALKIFTKYNDQLAAGKIEMNLSNIVSRRDEYRLAERYCLSAYRRFRKLGERSWQTMAENGLANTYAELNDFKRAEEFYERALEKARAGRMTVTVAEIEASMGNLALFRGRYADAVRFLELSRQKYEKLSMPHQTAVAELEIADIYAELNLNTEAVEIYRRLVPTLRRLKLRSEQARARANLGKTLIAAGEARGARVELKRAADLYGLEENFIAAAAVSLRQASLELSRGDRQAALTFVENASKTLDASENVRLRLSAMWLHGEILRDAGRLGEAEKILTKTLRESQKFEQPAVVQASLNSLGHIAQQRSRTKDAERFFRESILAAETTRSPLPGEEFRMAFLAKTMAPYENLAALYLAQNDLENAFTALESARSRSLLESIDDNADRRHDPDAAKLREELNWFYSRSARADDGEDRKIQKEIFAREKKLAALLLRAQSTRAAGRKFDGAEVDLEKLRSQLGDKCGLVEFVERDGNFSAFVVTSDGIEYVDKIAQVSDVLSLLDGLHFQFGSLRFGGDAIRAFASQLKARSDSYLRQLHDKLFAPLSALVRNRDLVVVPAGVLNYVPFGALFDGEKYLIETREIVSVPSAAVWQRLHSRRGRPMRNALLMAYADERIPLANDEVSRLAKVLPNSTKLAGRNATFRAFDENAAKFDLIHLACHGQFRADNPMFSSLHLADGWITVRDVCARKLRAELVTLSACETGLNQIFAGEEILGLARGFLTAGARSLLLSLWTVSDDATARLMADFYENLQRGAGVAASLRVAQLNLIKQGEHPYFWSPFFVVA